MCGIVGVVADREAAPLLLDALGRLEYRGYDSAGVATLVNGHLERRRAEGRLGRLAAVLNEIPLGGTTGIGHTRWATHGAPNERNAHPHATARVAVVHNGIIENHAELRAELQAEGQDFTTETDTEVVAQLIDLNLRRGMGPMGASNAALARLEGAYALAMIFAGHPDLIVCAQHGAPLAVGFGDNEMFVGSDSLALAPLTRRIAYLSDGDRAEVGRTGARFYDAAGGPIERAVRMSGPTAAAVDKGRYRHFMEKELEEHPTVIKDTLEQMLEAGRDAVFLPNLPFDLEVPPRVTISACGSAFYAGLTGRWWFETLARIPADADIASEFHYRMPPLPAGGLGLLVSQSGETADTLSALRYMRDQGQHIVSVLNVRESTMARVSDAVLETRAGPEIGVASTKAFTSQLVVLACLAIAMARARSAIAPSREADLVRALRGVPEQAGAVLGLRPEIQALARRIERARDVLFIGRGDCHPIALEGALKLKEISYIHAEGYAAGEMKHGPIALIDAKVPVVAVAPSGPLFEKTASNLREAAARGGQIVVFSDATGAAKLRDITAETIVMPSVDPFVAPILYAIALQLLAYQVAVLRGTDIDKPRNLAKSVTVE
jgi:glucosamine--fructose-6-phosphate aminotransferase (isomerizing)